MAKPSRDSAGNNALVLAPEAPYPVIGGGPIRTASILEYLRDRYRVHVVAFREPGDPHPRIPGDIVADVIELPYHVKSPLARAGRNFQRALRGAPPLVDRFAGFENAIKTAISGRHYRVAVVEHFWCAPYAEILRPRCERLILDLHNIESVLLERSAATERPPVSWILRRFAAACRSLERTWLPRYDDLLVTSEPDRTLAGPNAVVYPNALPLLPAPRAEKQNDIVFSGNLEYHPNVAAVRWFARHVWPVLRTRHPGLRWRIAGKNEARLRRELTDDRIVFTGAFDDAIAQLASARLAIVPVISGSGTRTKIIEAWAACLPVVSTAIGAEGLPYIPSEHLLIADSPADFTVAIDRVLTSTDLAARLAANGRRLYEERLTWPSAWKVLKELGL